MATVEFRYDPKNTAWFTANAAMVLKAGEPAYHDTTGLFKLGDGVTALSALSFLPTVSASTPTIQQVLTAGQVATTTIETTGFIKTGGLSTQFLKADGTVDSTVYGVGNALTSNPLSQFAATTSSQLAGVISDETGSGALVFGTSPTFTTNITTPQITGVSGVNGIRTITNNTASGAIARGLYHTPTLVAAANGDQLTSLDISPTFTNGAFTSVNNLALTMAMGTASIKMGNLSTTTTLAAIYFNQATPNSTNYTLQGSTTAVTLNNTTAVNIAINTTPILSANSSGAWNANAIAVTSGAVSSFNFTSPAHTNQTATTNIPNFRISGANKQWATGTVANQYWNYLTANTAAFVGASTMTNSYGLFVEAATAGTNATITNNYAAGFGGNIHQLNNGTNGIKFIPLVGAATYSAIYMNQATPSASNYTLSCGGSDTYIRGTTSLSLVTNQTIISISTTQVVTTDGINYSFGTTNGTKLGVSTSQKLSFWNATPIVQPTTAVAAATVVSGAGGTVKHDDTFDGYTVEKVVRALRTIGLLA